MKNLKLFAAAVMLAACTSASAQFSNAKGSSSSVDTEGWNTVWVQYNPGSWMPDEGDNMSFNSVSLGYSKAFSVSKSLPLFVEAGAGLQYTWSDEGSDEDMDVNTHLLSLKIPVDLMYKFDIPNSSVSIMPYLGVNLRYNAWG